MRTCDHCPLKTTAYLPVCPMAGALKGAEQRDGAVQGGHLSGDHGAEAMVPQGAGQGIILQPCVTGYVNMRCHIACNLNETDRCLLTPYNLETTDSPGPHG